MEKEFNLSEKVIEFDRTRGKYVEDINIKEFIKIIEARIYNQLRIHWHQWRNKSPREVADLIENIIDKRAGDKLIAKS